MPHNCELIGVEMGGKPIKEFTHPERAVYILGSEDRGLPEEILKSCKRNVELPSVRTPSFNVAVSGSIVMFDRVTKIN